VTPPELAIVVVGGPRYSVDHNTTPSLMVRELARRHRLLYLNSEANGSLLRRLQGRAGHMDWREVGRTAFGRMQPGRIAERLWLAPVRGLPAIGPLWAPEWMRKRNVHVFTNVIRAWLDEIGASRPLLVFYSWALPELIETVPNVGAVYDCTDDHAALPGTYASDSLVARLEGRLLDGVDRAYVVSPALLASREGPGRSVAVMPTAVDLRLFDELGRGGFAVPEAVAAVPSPRVGYVGSLGKGIDWDLLLEVISRCPQWNFVVVGGPPGSFPTEFHRPNVFPTGWLPFTTALAAMSAFDAAILPFMSQRFVRGNSSLKVREYFAHGLPVVATELPDTAAVASEAEGLLYLAQGPDEWESALGEALAEPVSSPLRAARRAYVEQRSAEQRAHRLIGEVLGMPEPGGAGS
jgi:glycosyltransferase involved in cell wall biosynthesis